MLCDVLVGYAWCRSSYTAIRSLNRLGLRVAVADSTKFGMGQCSKYTSARYVHTEPQMNPEKFISDIVNILNDCGAKFYLPGHDEGEIVAKYRHRFPQDVIIPLPDYDSLVFANNKMCTAQKACELGVPTPHVFEYHTAEELKGELPEQSDFVIKLRRGSGAKGVFYASDVDGVVSMVNDLIAQFDLQPDRYPIVQKKVNGEGWGVSCLYDQGERIVSFTHRRLREKTISGGTSTLRESAHNQQMEQYAHKLLDSLNWHGLAMVEFKWDPENKQAWFIEINPRLWGSIALPVACGVDFPAMLYFSSTGQIDKARKMVRDYKDNIVARWYLGDLILCVSLLAKMRPLDACRLLMSSEEDILDDVFASDIFATGAEFASYFLRFLKFRSTNPLDRGALG